jgi:glycosyltransferase involved in cell wall biosynthesis
LRIAFVTTSLGRGGAEAALVRLLERLPAGWPVGVVSLTGRGIHAEAIERLGIPVHDLGLRSPREALPALPRLVRCLRRLQPAIVQTWMYHADLLGGIAAWLAGVPHTVWSLHHADLKPATNPRRTLAVVRACAILSRFLPDRIVSCSAAGVDVHSAAGYRRERFTVIPNGVDSEVYRPDPQARASLVRELGIDATAPLVGLVARDHPHKNVAGFIAAAGRVHRRRADVVFLVAGTGLDEDHAGCAAAARAAGLGHGIRFLGPRDDMPRLMAALDMLAVSSVAEAFPLVLIEAMACAIPCVTTDVGDAARIVGDPDGVVPAGDDDLLADAILRMLDLDPDARRAIGAAARGRAIALYDLRTTVGRYASLYREVATGGHS